MKYTEKICSICFFLQETLNFIRTKKTIFNKFFCPLYLVRFRIVQKRVNNFRTQKKDRKKIKQNAIALEIIISLQSQMEHFVVGFVSIEKFRMIENKATNM